MAAEHTAAPGAAARTVGVSRRFGAFTAVQPTDIEVAGGEVVGMLGANGAGKTTLIKLILGLIRPSTGSVELFGSAPSRAGRSRVGYVPQNLGLYSDLTVGENWSFSTSAFARKGMPLPEGLGAWRDQVVGDLALGTQRQVAFAVALAHEPDLLILDEPTSGVGPLGSARLWEGIRAAAEAGAGALVTTHNLEEAEQCDRLVVMVDGAVVAAGRAEQIVGDRRVTTVDCREWSTAFSVLDALGLPVQVHGRAIRVGADPRLVAQALGSAGVEDASVAEAPASLEEAFFAIVSASS